MKKILYIDMDNVLVDFKSGIDELDEKTKKIYEGRLDEVPGIFSKMKPMPGALEAIEKLWDSYDIYILSTAPWENPSAWSDKLEPAGGTADLGVRRLEAGRHTITLRTTGKNDKAETFFIGVCRLILKPTEDGR